MNLSTPQAKYVGIALIILGIVAVLKFWWLIPIVAFIAAGSWGYRQRKALGRNNEAVQAALWGGGLAVLWLVHFLFPGVLLLAGASLLLRGHEEKLERRVSALIETLRRRNNLPSGPYNSPMTTTPTRVTIVNEETPTGNETVRLSK